MARDLGLHFIGPKSNYSAIKNNLGITNKVGGPNVIRTSNILWPASGTAYYMRDGSVITEMTDNGGMSYRLTRFDTATEYEQFESARANRFDPESTRRG